MINSMSFCRHERVWPCNVHTELFLAASSADNRKATQQFGDQEGGESFEVQKGLWRESVFAPEHIQDIMCVSLPLERSAWDLQCLQKFKFFWIISQSTPSLVSQAELILVTSREECHLLNHNYQFWRTFSFFLGGFMTKSCASNSGSMCNFVFQSSSFCSPRNYTFV